MSERGLAQGKNDEPLRTWLADLFAAKVELHDLHLLSGGAIQDNWAVDVEVSAGKHRGRHALVLRADAPSSIAASLARDDEFRVLREAWRAGVRVPEPLAACTDSGVLGRPFYAMRRIQGIAAGHLVVRACDTGGPFDGEALAGQLGGELARLHGIRPPRSALVCLGAPGRTPALDRIARYRAYLDALPQPRPALEWALRWLERSVPETNEVVLCHGDFRTGNYMVDAQSGVLTGILDWEFAAWSDPMEDLGWFCARCWRFGRDERTAGGVGTRASLFRGYHAVSGVMPDEQVVAWWEIMAAVRWAILALQQGYRHLSGAQRSLELALTARLVPEMELDALEGVEHLSGAAR